MKHTNDDKIKETEGVLLNDNELDAVAGGIGKSGYTHVTMSYDQFKISHLMNICPECGNYLTTRQEHNHNYSGVCESCKIYYSYRDPRSK